MIIINYSGEFFLLAHGSFAAAVVVGSGEFSFKLPVLATTPQLKLMSKAKKRRRSLVQDIQIFSAFVDEERKKRRQFGCFRSFAFCERQVLDSILTEKAKLELQR